MQTRYNPDHQIHELFARRWSPYTFSDKSIAMEDLWALFEAARFAPSSFNEQPWRFLVARKADQTEFQRMLNCLVPANQEWTQFAAALVLSFAKENFSKNNKPNRVAVYDVGAAAAYLTIEATARGIYVHQMAGIDVDKVRQEYQIPAGFQPLSAIALGYFNNNPRVPAHLKESDKIVKPRKNLNEFVFSHAWEQPYK